MNQPDRSQTGRLLWPLLLLIGVPFSLLIGIIGIYGETSGSPAVLAFTIVLPPAVFSYLSIGLIAKRWPQVGITAIVAGTGLRMGWAFIAVAMLGERAAEFQTTATAIAEWTTGFYIVSLIIETALLWRKLNA